MKNKKTLHRVNNIIVLHHGGFGNEFYFDTASLSLYDEKRPGQLSGLDVLKQLFQI